MEYEEIIISWMVAFILSGCASYIPPGANADLRAFAPTEALTGYNPWLRQYIDEYFL